MTSTFRRSLAPAVVALAVVALALALPAYAQQQNPMCGRLEGQLATFDRGASDPARAEQVRRYEEALARQQAEIDKMQARAKAANCEGGFFLFGNKAPECAPLSAQIQQMRANVDKMQAELSRMQGDSGPEHDAQRRAILVALSQNNCGAQYGAQVAAQPPQRGLFESLFGPKSVFTPGEGSPPGEAATIPAGSYRTLCVRTCDGYYFPISFATTPARFAEDARTCQRSCPAAEVQLYTHRNPGEDVNQAVSLTTQSLYTALPSAFKYRQAVDAACSCRKPGESWAQALKGVEDSTVERGDIVVNEQRAKLLSQPRIDAQGKPIRQAPAPKALPAPVATTRPPADETQTSDPNRTVRSVGPTFIPTR